MSNRQHLDHAWARRVEASFQEAVESKQFIPAATVHQSLKRLGCSFVMDKEHMSFWRLPNGEVVTLMHPERGRYHVDYLKGLLGHVTELAAAR